MIKLRPTAVYLFLQFHYENQTIWPCFSSFDDKKWWNIEEKNVQRGWYCVSNSYPSNLQREKELTRQQSQVNVQLSYLGHHLKY